MAVVGVAMKPLVSFTVYGRPAPMGSKKAFVTQRPGERPRAHITDVNSDARKLWANGVRSESSLAMEGKRLTLSPVVVRLSFYFSRPKADFGTGRNSGILKKSAPDRHIKRPDLDKLVRCVCDAMTGTVWWDDTQIYSVHASKHWTLHQERAQIEVMVD
jgi:Holliday junction resolvase RusA-like endonuclease